MASRKGAARAAASSRGRGAPKKKTSRQSGSQALATDEVPAEAGEPAEAVVESSESAEPASEEPVEESSEAPAPEPASDSEQASEPSAAPIDADAETEDALPLDVAFDAGDDEEPGVGSGPAVEASEGEAGGERDAGDEEVVEDAPATDERIEDTAGFLKGLIEALLFVSDRPLELKEVARAARIDRGRAAELLDELKADYQGRGIRLEEIGGGFSFRSSPTFATQVRDYLSLRPVRLSRAQLETLAIVAYRQPITRPEIDDIRGVDSGPVLKGLLERDLIRIIGKKDEPGRPMLYGTTPAFLEVFSLTSLRDLPTLREYTELSDESRQTFETEIGEPAPEGQMLEELSAAAEASPGVELVGEGEGEGEAEETPVSEATPESEPAADETSDAATDSPSVASEESDDEDDSDDDDSDDDDEDDSDDDDSDDDDDDDDDDSDDDDEDDEDDDDDDDDDEDDDDDDSDDEDKDEK
jgi:segregation and condensation protein B